MSLATEQMTTEAVVEAAKTATGPRDLLAKLGVEDSTAARRRLAALVKSGRIDERFRATKIAMAVVPRTHNGLREERERVARAVGDRLRNTGTVTVSAAAGSTITVAAPKPGIGVTWSDEPVPADDQTKAFCVLMAARAHWPYVTQTLSTAKNGRETGTFIAGQVFARRSAHEPGIRVEILEEYLAGAAAVLVDAGLTVTKESNRRMDGEPPRVTLAVWVEHDGT